MMERVEDLMLKELREDLNAKAGVRLEHFAYTELFFFFAFLYVLPEDDKAEKMPYFTVLQTNSSVCSSD